MSERKKNDWKPNPQQREILEALKFECGENKTEFCTEFGNATIGTPSKLTQILDALGLDKVSYFNKIEDPEGLMRDITSFMDDLPELKQRRLISEDTDIFATSHFRAAEIAARACRNKKSAERCIQFIAPTGGSKSYLYAHLSKTLRNEFSMAFVNCRDSWKPATRDLRQRAKMTVLQDICAGLKFRLTGGLEEFKHEDAPAIEDAIVKYLGKRSVLMYIEEGRFLCTYPLNLFIDLLNRTRLVLVVTSTPFADKMRHRYFGDEANQLDRRSEAVIRVSVISPADAGLFFKGVEFENRDACLQEIATAASKFGHFSLISRLTKFFKKIEKPDLADVQSAITKASTEMNHRLEFSNR